MWLQLSLVGVICLVGLMSYAMFSRAVTQEAGVIYYLKPGTSKKALVKDLQQLGLLRYPRLFALYIYTMPRSQLKTGEYLFPQGASAYTIWKQITRGKGIIYHSFTIIPGWTFSQLRHELAKVDGIRHRSKHLTDHEIMVYLDYTHFAPEGEFYPETYTYTKGIADLAILKEAFLLMQEKMMTSWAHRAPGLPYADPYDALIAASLIEKEAHLDAERPVIAGVLINRLHKDMLLQFDPTVIYGMGARYQGKIHKEDLTSDSAYNTYLHKGLPPTPIALPGLASIEAALHPMRHDYLYFVAKGDGSHLFSKTLDEHQTNIASVAPAMKQPEWFFNATKIRGFLDKLPITQPYLKQMSEKQA